MIAINTIFVKWTRVYNRKALLHSSMRRDFVLSFTHFVSLIIRNEIVSALDCIICLSVSCCLEVSVRCIFKSNCRDTICIIRKDQVSHISNRSFLACYWLRLNLTKFLTNLFLISLTSKVFVTDASQDCILIEVSSNSDTWTLYWSSWWKSYWAVEWCDENIQIYCVKTWIFDS